jgi:hypothetical protein
MKKALFGLFFVLITGLAFSQTVDSVAFKFEEEKFDFGDINQGQQVEHIFKFTNTGVKPLVISNIVTSCGCTAPTWPKNPIPPKGNGEIKIDFNSAGKSGKQNKVITIMSNAVGNPNHIVITANVLPPKQ